MNLFLDIARSCQKCSVWTPIQVIRSAWLTFVLLAVKVYVPYALYLQTTVPIPEEDVGTLIIGFAGWTMVMFQAEEDMLRDIWWICTLWNSRGKERQAFHDISTSWRDWLGVILSLIYDAGSSLAFGFCTWSIMRSSPTILDKAKDCAALTAVLYVDEAIYEHHKFDVPGARLLWVTPYHQYSFDQADKIVGKADRIVMWAHYVISCAIFGCGAAYIVEGLMSDASM